MSDDEAAYLPTTPGTQMTWEVRSWCAGHRWRYRRGLGWAHRLGHRARVLRVKPRKRPLVYIASAIEKDSDNGRKAG